jgi:hypothetical protein
MCVCVCLIIICNIINSSLKMFSDQLFTHPSPFTMKQATTASLQIFVCSYVICSPGWSLNTTYISISACESNRSTNLYKFFEVRAFSHTHVYIHTHTHTHIHTCIHTHTHIYIHTHTYIHTFIHACMHTCVCMCVNARHSIEARFSKCRTELYRRTYQVILIWVLKKPSKLNLTYLL